MRFCAYFEYPPSSSQNSTFLYRRYHLSFGSDKYDFTRANVRHLFHRLQPTQAVIDATPMLQGMIGFEMLARIGSVVCRADSYMARLLEMPKLSER